MTQRARATPRPSVRPPCPETGPTPETPAFEVGRAFPVTFTVEGDPVPQPRPRVFRNGGVSEDPRATRHKQAHVMAAVRARVRRLTGPVDVTLVYYRATARRCDWDNLAKLTCDALNGITWADDSQIAHADVTVLIDRERPRTEVTVRAWPPVVVPVDWHAAWEGCPADNAAPTRE